MEFPNDADMMPSKGALHPLEALLILVSYTIKKEEMSMESRNEGKGGHRHRRHTRQLCMKEVQSCTENIFGS